MASRLDSKTSSEEADWAEKFFQEITKFMEKKDIDVMEVSARINVMYPNLLNNSAVEAIKMANPGPDQFRKFRNLMIDRGIQPEDFVKAVNKNRTLYSKAKKYLEDHPCSSTEGWNFDNIQNNFPFTQGILKVLGLDLSALNLRGTKLVLKK